MYLKTTHIIIKKAERISEKAGPEFTEGTAAFVCYLQQDRKSLIGDII